ncbi:MAG: ABC transporter substrate-binding protein [Alphaproteobacteria bacterium]|nr:ABC transporter substrate-binding protein [Alphaproteobacteria bacterium]
MKRSWIIAPAVVAAAMLGVATSSVAAERTVKIAGFGAKSGVVRSFGVNTEAVMRAAADHINKGGGVKLGDGATGKIEVTFDDDRCNAEEGISVLRRIAGTDAVVAVGPTCSNVAEPLFGILQKKVGDAGDSGVQMPIFTDTAIKGGLAKISDWAFRNVPNESEMYQKLFAWIKAEHGELKTVYGGVEEDFAHSRFTWHKVMKVRAPEAGFEVVGESKWLLNDTNFATQVREMKKAKADIVAISAHPFTTCGVLKEMQRQRVKPKLLVGLTSSSSLETLQGCAKQAEGIIIPTSFAPVTPAAKVAADLSAEKGGSADLHSAAAWEIMMVLKGVIETSGVTAKPDTVQDDRRKIRDGLAALKETEGLLGTIQRTAEGEAIKPYVYVHAKGGSWAVLHDPGS